MPSPRHSHRNRPSSPAPTALTTDTEHATAWEQGAVVEDWAPFYFPSKTLYGELRSAAAAVVPQAAWAAHVAEAEKAGRKPQKPDDIVDYVLRQNLNLGRRLHRLNCFIVSRITPSLDIEIEEVRFNDGRKSKSFAVGESTGPAGDPLMFSTGEHGGLHASQHGSFAGAGSNPPGDAASLDASTRQRSAKMGNNADVHAMLRSRRETRAAEALAAQMSTLPLLLTPPALEVEDDQPPADLPTPSSSAAAASAGATNEPFGDTAACSAGGDTLPPAAGASPPRVARKRLGGGMRPVASRGDVSLFAQTTPPEPAGGVHFQVDPPPALVLTEADELGGDEHAPNGETLLHLDGVPSATSTPAVRSPQYLTPDRPLASVMAVSQNANDHADEDEFVFTTGNRGESVDIRTPTNDNNNQPRRRGSTDEGPPLVSNDSFANFGHLSMAFGGQSFAALPPETQEEQLLEAVHAVLSFNVELSEKLKQHVGTVNEFYSRTTAIVSGCAAACIEHLKQTDNLSKRERSHVEKTVHQTAYSLAMLQEYCDHNFVAIHHFLKEIGGTSFQRFDVGSSLMSQPFFMTRQSSSIAQLREMVIEYYAEYLCDGDRAEADARIARFADPDDGLEASHIRLDRASQAAVAGLIVGVIGALAMAVLFLFVGEQFLLKHVENGEHAAYLFSVSGVPILFGLLFTANVAVWERYRINFAFSFHLHPFKHFTSMSTLIHNGAMTIVWLMCAFFFLRAAGLEFAELEAEHALNALTECTRTIETATTTPASCPGISANDTTVSNARAVQALLLGTVARESKAPLVPAYLWAYLVFPLALVVFVIGRVVKRMSGEPGFLLPAVGRLLATPYFAVSFTDFFICEQLVSLADVFFEWTWLFCAFDTSNNTTSAHYCREGRKFYVCAIAMLPAWWRTLQSLRRFKDNPTQRSFYPHLLNATKYFISLVRMGIQVWFAIEFRGAALDSGKENADGDTIFVEHNESRQTASLVLFCVAYTIETIVKMGYEIWVEYGVMRCNARFPLLRDTLLYPQAMYYPCMILNFIVRWLWVLKLLVTKFWNDEDPQWAFPLFAVLEVIRRIMWNWFRVEYDQVDNTENYKAVQIAPLQSIRHASDSVDWQLTAEDVERQFGPVSPNTATPATAAVPEQPFARERTSDSTLLAAGDAPAPARRRSSLHRAQPVTTKVAAFFHELPMSERIEVLRTILPPSEFEEEKEEVHDTGLTPRARTSANNRHHFKTFFKVHRSGGGGNGPAQRLPPTMLFNALHEEDKVRALLLRVGRDRTLDEYHADVLRKKAESHDPRSGPATPTADGRHAPQVPAPHRRNSGLGQRSNNKSRRRRPLEDMQHQPVADFIATPAEEEMGTPQAPPAIVASGTPTVQGSSGQTPEEA